MIVILPDVEKGLMASIDRMVSSEFDPVDWLPKTVADSLKALFQK